MKKFIFEIAIAEGTGEFWDGLEGASNIMQMEAVAELVSTALNDCNIRNEITFTQLEENFEE